jgi:hypothetical protein
MNLKHIFKTIMCAALVGYTTACSQEPKNEAKADTESKENTSAKQDAAAMPVNTNKENTDVTGEKAQITFATTEYKFGEVKEGEKVNYKFKFKNTGKAPLIIQDAKASCGCTVPSYTKDPIAVDSEGEIAVSFDSQGKPGTQSKTVTVTSNGSDSPITLTITGFVKGMSNMNGPLANPPK